MTKQEQIAMRGEIIAEASLIKQTATTMATAAGLIMDRVEAGKLDVMAMNRLLGNAREVEGRANHIKQLFARLTTL